jgi:peptidoglycan/xylan/chitin deacetylase (PgdA/CDA1 family)
LILALTTDSKRWVKRLLTASHAMSLAARFAPPAALILAYHSVHDHPDSYADTIGTNNIHEIAVFAAHMELVARRFSPVTLDEILLFLEGKGSLPPRAVAVTFDDGYRDNLEFAAPVLAHYGIRGTFFVTVDYIDSPRLPWFIRLRYAFWNTRLVSWRDPWSNRTFKLDGPEDRRCAFLAACEYGARRVGAAQEEVISGIERELEIEPPAANGMMMTWDEVRKLHAAGHLIGSHTLTHPNMAFVSEQEARLEFQESKRRLENELGVRVEHFSYPHPVLDPNWTERTVEISREVGFVSGVTTVSAPVRPGQSPYSLPRLYTPRELSDFRWHLERSLFQRGQGRMQACDV